MTRGRAPLPLGTHGDVRVYSRGSGFIARTLYRDYDGVTREVTKTGPTKTAAKTALKEELQGRHRVGGSAMARSTRVEELAAMYEEAIVRSDSLLSKSTQRLYRSHIKNSITPWIGKLTLAETTPSKLQRFLRKVGDERGHASAKSCRSVLTKMFALAVSDGVIDHNPALEITLGQAPKKEQKNALTLEQLASLTASVATDKRAVFLGVDRLVHGFAYTGLRMSELIALEWPAFDSAAGTLNVGEQIAVRETGVGLYIHRDKTSNKLTPRTLTLPPPLVAMLRTWQVQATGPLIFPSPKGQLRDPSNTNRDLVATAKRLGFPWVTSHTFRRTLITALEKSGTPYSEIQAWVGHRSRNTTEIYIVKGTKATAATALFDRAS